VKETPKAVYKYLSAQRASAALDDLMIRFSQFSVLNDARELKPHVIGFASPDFIKQFISREFDSLSDMEKDELTARACLMFSGFTKDRLRGFGAQSWCVVSLRDACRDLNVVPLCRWRRGAVLQLKADHPWFWTCPGDVDFINRLRKVKYTNRRTPRYLTDLDSLDFFYTKDAVWSYEKEWRVVSKIR